VSARAECVKEIAAGHEPLICPNSEAFTIHHTE
jgi:hypothetical protein